MARTADYVRKTKETDISLHLNLDGTGSSSIHTGIGFFDHMLDGFARHGLFDLKVNVAGDLAVDCHHTIEDTGIVLGNAIKEAVGDKKGIRRYGSCILPMDETLVLCAVDLSGRPYLVFDGEFTTDRVGYGYGDGERIFLCHFLYRRNESAYQGAFRRKQPPYD
jgi:imidazoleglycerol-phosphate dehydratase